MADSLRIALGEPPVEQRTCERGVALFWVPTRSGVVTRIEGLDEAAALPGLVEVVMSVKAGDIMQHVVDCVTRDKVGYVLATGASARDAVATAKRARGLVRVLTEPVTG